MMKLSAIGDIALFGDYAELIRANGHKYPFEKVSARLSKNDVVLANLETPLSDRGNPDKTKPISFCGPPSAIDSLSSSGITHVSLANNHSYDYGRKAVTDTQERLTNAGIPFVGIGDNLAHARRPLVENYSGVKLAILAYNSYTTNGRCYATRKRDGVAPLEYRYILSDIQSIKAKYENCFILISLHWGVEGDFYPTPFQQDLARQIIKDGADLIIGHHPHVIQGIEEFEHGLIVYSLGNFCFPSVTSPHIRGIGFSQKRENRESYIFQCEITPVGLGPYSVVPVSLNHDLQPVIASGATESKIHAQIQYLSEPLNQLNYKKLYFEKQNKKVNQKSRLSSLWKKEGFLGVIKRLRIIYIMAYLIAFVNSLREAKHRRHFFSLLSNKIKD